MTRKCIVCGKPIRKRTNYLRFEEPREYRPRTTKVICGHEMTDQEERQAKPEGTREVSELGNVTLYTANKPRTKEDCQRFTNGTVLSVKRDWRNPEFIGEFSFWDGSSYMDEFFHSGECAQKQGYAAARDGHRWVWK